MCCFVLLMLESLRSHSLMPSGDDERTRTETSNLDHDNNFPNSKVSWSIFSKCHGKSNQCVRVKKKVAPDWKTILKFDNSHKILPQCLN